MNTPKDVLITSLCQALSLIFKPFTHSRRKLPEPASILLIKPCCIGDVLMATATIGAVKSAWPQSRLAVMVGGWSRQALLNNSKIDELFDYSDPGNGKGADWKSYFSMVKELRQRHFDLALVLDRSPLMSLLPLLAGIPNRVGLDSKGRGFSLTTRVRWTGMRHEAELYLDTLRAIGVEPAEAKLEFFPSDAETTWARERLLQLRTQSIVAVHLGGGENPGQRVPAKRWPPERFAAVIGRLLEEGRGVVLVGAPNERPLADRVRSLMQEKNMSSDYLLDIVGKTSLGQLGAILSRCDLFLGNDSGPTHLAVAVGTPVVAIFGPSDPAMYGPFSSKSVVLQGKVPCGPCFFRGAARADCDDFKCIKAVTVEQAREAVGHLLKSGKGPV